MNTIPCPNCNTHFNPEGKWGLKKFCSRKCANKRIKTKQDKEKIKDIMQGLGSFTKIKYCVCEVCSTHFRWDSITKGSTRHCNNTRCFQQFKYNVRKGKVGGFKPNSTRKTRSIYNGYQMDSGAELAFAQLLDKHNIKWIKNSTTWFEYLPGKKYYPDFYLEEFNQWIEIKGKYYLREDDTLRWQSVPGLEVIWANNLKLPTCFGGPME